MVKAITYDAIGNPLTYDGWNFTWEEGRQLKTLNDSQYDITFKYNDKGVRTEKTVNGVTTKYHLVGDKVTSESNGTDTIYYTYDSSNNLVSMNLNGVEYYYIRNGQGDIVGLFDSTGTEVVSYTYDSWGKLISIDGSLKDTVGVKNPYRYRGYRYDTESGLYYLQSRYYNPEFSRMLNADDTDILTEQNELLGKNLFVYCANNPVNHSDESGYWKLPNWAKVTGVVATVASGGAAAPALVGALAIAGSSTAVGAASGALISGASTLIGGGSVKSALRNAGKGAIDGAVDGFMWGGIGVATTGIAIRYKKVKLKKIGRIKPTNRKGKGYYGAKYKVPKANGHYTTKSFEFHTPHNGHGYHWQQNPWNPTTNGINSKKARRWTWYGRRF